VAGVAAVLMELFQVLSGTKQTLHNGITTFFCLADAFLDVLEIFNIGDIPIMI
jgi:hypothetical protein